jgi:hypothetical protein
MGYLKQIICPVSAERIDENRVRATALGVTLTMGTFFITGIIVFPAFLALDFFIRAFTKLRYSPLSWLAHLFVNAFGTRPVLINKAPKVFAARVGFLLTTITTIAALVGLNSVAFVAGAALVGFAFLECGLNFCAGCWVYTFVVYPLVRKDHK